MKFKPHGIILSLFLALGLIFSFSIVASGTHGDSTITAQQVADDPGNEQKMTDFVNRIVAYYEHVRADNIDDRAALIRELTIFARNIRREGTYRHDDIYAVGITDNNVITNHARYPELIGYTVNPDAGTTLANTFKALLNESNLETTECQDYQYDDQSRVACAKKVVSDLTDVDVTNIAGLHHEADDDAFVPPDCSGLTLNTTAEDVFNDPTDANLKAYVKDVIEAVQEDIKDITVDELTKLIEKDPKTAGVTDLVFLADSTEQQKLDNKVKTRIQERFFCFGSGDFNSGNIYVFVMDKDLEESRALLKIPSYSS